MPRTSVVIAQAEGLHARPAAQFVKLAARFESAVKVRLDGKEANAKSILSVLALGASKGSQVDLEADGDDAQRALDELSAFLVSGGRT